MTRCPHGRIIPARPFESGLHTNAAWPQCPCCKHLEPRDGCMTCDPEGTRARRLDTEENLYNLLGVPPSVGYFHEKERRAAKRRWWWPW